MDIVIVGIDLGKNSCSPAGGRRIDPGTTVETKEGLVGDETVTLNPPADIRNGRKFSIQKRTRRSRHPA
jgi:hypothetical protein